jgi:hypothetical protein
LWRQGQQPDLARFLAGTGPLPPLQLAAVLRVDQRERWQRGDRVLTEDYLRDFPAVAADPEAALDLVYGEILLREERGEPPAPDEYRRRFPQYADTLSAQLGLRRALGTPSFLTAPTVPELPHPVDQDGLPHIPGYQALERLGGGTFGVVYRARQLSVNRVVALKCIKDPAFAEPEHVARFRQEAEIVARLTHPHIVQVFDFGEHEGQPYFALELAEGGDLQQKLHDGPLPPLRAAELVRALAGAVHAAHERGVVHRDLKPANVLLGRDGTPKVTDFGLAKQLDHQASASGAMLGTPAYMAPEQARGRNREVGPAVDVYALGAILYECVTGRPPFRAATVLQTLEQVCTQEPVPPRQFNPAIDRDLETICLKCLQKEAGKRYGSTAALAEDLRRFLNQEPIVARPVGRLERAAKWVRRRPTTAALLGVSAVASVVLVTLVVSLLFYRQLRQAYEETDRQRQAAEKSQGEAEKARQGEARERGRAENLLYAMSLERALSAWRENDVERAEQILQDCRPKQPPWDKEAPWEWRYLHHLCHSDLLTLKGHIGQVHSVAFSPDGNRIASGSGIYVVRVWDTEVWRGDSAIARQAWHQQQARYAEQGGQWFAAAFHLKGLTLQEPGHAALHWRLGLARAAQGEWPAALADFGRAVRLAWGKPPAPNRP